MKALALLSGGLDSTIAVKLIIDQGIDVVALKFTSLFCSCDQKGVCHAAEVARKFNIPLKIMKKGDDYLRIVRNPKHGHGSGMNPCIDCRIYILKKAKKYAEEIGASFIFTGDVLDERPMSQHMKALKTIEKGSGMEGKILRPLSARLLPETEAEKKGWVDRNKLLAIHGRSRKPQISLAKKLGINNYPCPAGGCLLTYKEFANKVRDLLKYNKNVTPDDVVLLKVGRHFRVGRNKVVVGRNEDENTMISSLKRKTDYVFEVQDCGSPLTILQGSKTASAIKMAARLTARYSDSKLRKVVVKYGNKKPVRSVTVAPVNDDEIKRLRI